MQVIQNKRKFNQRKEGFTLVELLLGLIIFSLVSVAVYSVFWGGIRLDYQSEVQNEVLREVRLAFDLLARELENMLFYDFSSSYPEKVSFQAKPGEIMLLSSENDELKVISYFLEDPNDSEIVGTVMGGRYAKNIKIETVEKEEAKEFYLVRTEQAFVDYLSDKPPVDKKQEVIATHLKENGLRFSFGIADSEESEEVTWSESWGFSYLPSYVKIEMDFILSGESGSVKTFSKKILIPVGFVGSRDEGEDLFVQ
jgi:type II secretion system protein J